MPKTASTKKRMVRNLIATKQKSAWPFQNGHNTSGGFSQLAPSAGLLSSNETQNNKLVAPYYVHPSKKARNTSSGVPQAGIEAGGLKQQRQSHSLEVQHFQRIKTPHNKRVSTKYINSASPPSSDGFCWSPAASTPNAASQQPLQETTSMSSWQHEQMEMIDVLSLIPDLDVCGTFTGHINHDLNKPAHPNEGENGLAVKQRLQVSRLSSVMNTLYRSRN